MITALPAAPSRNEPSTFSDKADAFLGALPTFATEANALASDVSSKQSTASTAASTATTKASEASASADAAALSEAAAEEAADIAVAAKVSAEAALDAFDDKYLGAKASDPTVDNDGNPLQAGAFYINTGSGYIRAYTGSTWVNAISAVAGVSSVNGESGDISGFTKNVSVQTLTNKTLESTVLTNGYTEEVYDLVGTVINPANGSIQTKTLAANTTFTESIADGQSVILGITAGSYTVTWPSVTWAKVGGSGVAPTLTSTGVNWVVLFQVGGTLRAAFLGTA